MIRPPPLPVNRLTLDLRLGMAADSGFTVHRGVELVGAFTTVAEMCRWIEDEWRQYDPQMTAQDMPQVVQMQDHQQRRSGRWLSR